jgi:membrane protein required for colicin V production
LNWLDIAIAVIVTLPAYFGYRKGFLRKLLGIAGVIAGFILAVKFYTPVSGILANVIPESLTAVKVISFLLIIGILYGASIWLARFIANVNSGTSLIDKTLGFIFGFAQGLIVSSVLLYNLNLAGFPSQKTRETSLLYSNVIKIAPVIFDKVIEFFPGLHDLYNNYKNSPVEETSPKKQ